MSYVHYITSPSIVVNHTIVKKYNIVCFVHPPNCLKPSLVATQNTPKSEPPRTDGQQNASEQTHDPAPDYRAQEGVAAIGGPCDARTEGQGPSAEGQ